MKSKERKELEKHRKEILAELPSFLNHLLLLLNSGMVLHEAMHTIALNYQITDYYKKNIFANEYVTIYLDTINTGNNILNSFNDYCKKSQIKELSRIGRMLVDGDKRGTDLSLKLYEEAKNLWEQRKRMALKEIRLKESKMSFPLGLLLIALILISAAPAMMQMYI